MENIKISVRSLVEFSLHGEDIVPGSIKKMHEGMLGHKARQSLIGDEWESEVPVSFSYEVDNELILNIAGRMDAFRAGEKPAVEEIKLADHRNVPQEAYAAHWAQAICYAFMISEKMQYQSILVRVIYVDVSGKTLAVFEQQQTHDECLQKFQNLLQPFVRRILALRKHEHARNASLYHLNFPFETYRSGQRQMAVQVYTAIRRNKRLFASIPTGTGKSIASLFPALKALGEGWTKQIFYLTARTTQRQGPVQALQLLRKQAFHCWVLVLNSKDKQCPECRICHPDYCPRAKGHFLRDQEAIEQLLQVDNWSPEVIQMISDRYCLCPFELSLSLSEIADVVICDYNYALDPAVHIQRIFDHPDEITLLFDEAHHLLDRTRNMLGGTISASLIKNLRTDVGKSYGRKHLIYQSLSKLINALMDLPVYEEDTDCSEGNLEEISQSLEKAVESVFSALIEHKSDHQLWSLCDGKAGDIISEIAAFRRSFELNHEIEYQYIWIRTGKRSIELHAFPLDISTFLYKSTQKMQGVIYFSATFEPLKDMKLLLGGEEEDACFSNISSFPSQNLLIVQKSIGTRYHERKATAGEIAESIEKLIQERPGRYICYLPSFAYLHFIDQKIGRIPHQSQRENMSDSDRDAFLQPYKEKDGEKAILSLCVMGGIFSQGIDLPGNQLNGVIIVGVGLPQVNIFQETLRNFYEKHFGDGFYYAYQIPGIQKVTQSVGRLIRTETDTGVALLLDDRYLQQSYRRLCPQHWNIQPDKSGERLRAFIQWQSRNN